MAIYYGHVDGAPFEIVFNDVDETIDEATELAAGAQPFRPSASAGTAGAAGGQAGKPDFKQLDELQLHELIKGGQSYYHASCELLWRWAQQGVAQTDARRNLEAVFYTVAVAIRDAKWRKGRARIPVWLTRAYERAAAAAAKQKKKGAGRPLTFVAPKPWPQPVDGEALADELVTTITGYVVLPEAAAHAVTLWVIHTYCFTNDDHAAARAQIAAEKVRQVDLLTIIEHLAARAICTANISAPALYRTVEQAQPTLLVDEADTFVRENEELRGVLNAGFMRGGQVIHTIGDDYEPRAFSCWAPVAVATIRKLPDTIEDRSIAVVMKRRSRPRPLRRCGLIA